MHLQFTYTFNDYAEASAAVARLSRVRTIVILIGLLLINLIIGLPLINLIIGLPLDQANHSLKWFVSSLYPFLIVLVLMTPWGIRLINYVIWQFHRSSHKVITYEINDRAVIAATDTWRSEMKWETFTRFVESKNVFVLYTSRYLYYMLPKRAFEREDELAEFRELAQRRVSGHK